MHSMAFICHVFHGKDMSFHVPSKHAYMGPIWATHMGPIWGVQPGSTWVPYGLAHMRVAQMGPIWVPYNSPIKKKNDIIIFI